MEEYFNYLNQLSGYYKVYFAVFFFVFGTCIGSFINVCVFRFPQGMSIVKPRSFCPNCKKPICWYENIPLISYLVLKAKCSSCGSKISLRYFLVEFFSGVLLVLLFLHLGLTVKFFWIGYFIFSLLIVTWVDVLTMEIPDEITLTGIPVGVIFAVCFPVLMQTDSHWWALGKSALGALTGAGIIWLTALIGDFVFKRESMGGGDLKLLAMVGAFLGTRDVVLTFFLAPFLALPFGLYLKYVKKTEVIAYGPFLAVAAVFSAFCSDWLINFVLGLY